MNDELDVLLERLERYKQQDVWGRRRRSLLERIRRLKE